MLEIEIGLYLEIVCLLSKIESISDDIPPSDPARKAHNILNRLKDIKVN